MYVSKQGQTVHLLLWGTDRSFLLPGISLILGFLWHIRHEHVFVFPEKISMFIKKYYQLIIGLRPF